MADLTEDQIEDILTSDESNGQLAKRLNSHHLTIKKIRSEGLDRAHNEDGTFKADDPDTEINEAYKLPEVHGKGQQVCDGPTTGYRDGKDGVVERCEFINGFLPDGWHDTPAKCKNCDGKSHPEYVDI